MKFGKTNRYKLTEDAKNTISALYDMDDKPEHTECFGYPLRYNHAIGKYIHMKSFGTKNDYEYGSYTDIVVVFDRDRLNLSVSANGGMTWLLFDERDVSHTRAFSEREVMQYTIKFVNDLMKKRVIQKIGN